VLTHTTQKKLILLSTRKSHTKQHIANIVKCCGKETKYKPTALSRTRKTTA
jgi:hypothetical protein